MNDYKYSENELRRSAQDAAEAVAKKANRRLVLQVFAAALATAAAIALIVALAIGRDWHDAAQAQARYECARNSEIALILGKFVKGDAELRKEQANLKVDVRLLNDLGRIIPPRIERDLHIVVGASQSLSDQFAARWSTVYAPELLAIANSDCKVAK